MAYIVGADGCKAGWLAIHKDLNSSVITSKVYTSSDQLISQSTNPNVLGLDIPIGLTESGPRQLNKFR